MLSPRALTARLVRGSGRTEISLSQKQQIQQLWLLQETQICTGLISLGLYHHTKSRSYYALCSSQGLTLSGIGEMIPQPPESPDASFPQHSHCWSPHCPAPGRLFPARINPVFAIWTPREPSPFKKRSRVRTPQGRL